jgi:metal-responsive CopG/Arc/MetJ family transcriptional regulator
MKTISITIDEPLLRAVDKVAAAAKRTRSDLCRMALSDWLAGARHRELARADREAYARHPVTGDEFGDLLAAQVLDDAGRRR